MGKAGNALKMALETYGISQTQLAKTLGIGRSNVYRWVNGVRDPNSETLVLIVKALSELNPEAASLFKRLYMDESPLQD
ncbi:helix-turn-helix transcriptional regulator [Thermoleptolyngbya oregonensis NK1-22]|uniref:Helix-turn-helix transcriptional regulator n=1 Tax=Thermoleptolyngbya oregonensis NK1-22 TaxID=2547457 RepID=A0AA97BPJ9_9CYAN|nr:helix-turn-helix transcriptional regulator [Thermoleptolyngbya oregonensis]WOB43108.1 helix-turn-helix transcriptional regulator [Thermoleptolyngbya oregonensis NK1-22]